MEHRWGQRVPVGTEVRLVCRPSAVGAGWLRDASMSGAYVATDLDVPLYSRLRVELDVRASNGRSATRRLAAYVVRRDAAGLGIEWHVLAPAELEDFLTDGRRASAQSIAAGSWPRPAVQDAVAANDS